jgi:hypothetical protein
MKDNAPASPPISQARPASHSVAAGVLGTVEAGGRSTRIPTVAIGAQTRPITKITTTASPVSFSQPDRDMRRPNIVRAPHASGCNKKVPWGYGNATFIDEMGPA